MALEQEAVTAGYRTDSETVALEGIPIGGGYGNLWFPPPCGEESRVEIPNEEIQCS